MPFTKCVSTLYLLLNGAYANKNRTASSNSTEVTLKRLLARRLLSTSPEISWDRSKCTTTTFIDRAMAVRARPRKKVLVTGAAGFIGSHVAEFTVDVLGWKTAVDDLSGGFNKISRKATLSK